MTKLPEASRLARVAAARKALAERYAADPAGVARFEARMARIAEVRRREQERIDILVMRKDRPKASTGKRVKKGKATRIELSPDVETELALREKWSHKRGTAQTHAKAASHTDCLDQMERNGSITKDQREWAAEIANVYRSIESDVAVSIASLEARVDNSSCDRNRVAESVKRVRLHSAYTHWRSLLPAPKQMVLDMIVGDTIGYVVAAGRYRTHPRKAKRELLLALDRWPDCKAHAFRTISAEDVRRAA